MRTLIGMAAAIALLTAGPASAGKPDGFATWEECVVVATALSRDGRHAFVCVQNADGRWVIDWLNGKKKSSLR